MVRGILGLFGIISGKDKDNGQPISSNRENVRDSYLYSYSKVVCIGYIKYFEKIMTFKLNNKYLDISKRGMKLTGMNSI